MGQYHILANIDKKEKVEPYGIGLGLKQWEHLGEYNGTMADAMYLLCMSSPAQGGGDLPRTEISGRWAGDRVLIVGDYTDSTLLPSVPNAEELYREADTHYADISSLVADAFKVAFGVEVIADKYWQKSLEAVVNERVKRDANQ